MCTPESNVSPEEKFGLTCLLSITSGLAWVVDLPGTPGRGSIQTRTRLPWDPSVSHPETLEGGRENRCFGSGEPVYIVPWFSETVVQTSYLPFKSTPTEETWEARPHYLLNPCEMETLGGQEPRSLSSGSQPSSLSS